jgi:TP901 family phage tail tape measure protein
VNSFLNIQVRILAQQAQAMLRQLNTQMNSIGSGGFNTGRLDRIGSQMQWLGRQIEYNFTVPLAIAGTAATKMALDNEAAFTRITKVYGDAAHGAQFYHAELDSLKKAFVALSDEFGIAQSDALNIAADWAAAGASGLALAKSVELTLKTMVLGELDAGKATQSLIAIQAQYGLSISQLADTIDTLNMVENQTGVSMAGLIDAFARTAGVARASGVDVRHLAADVAALTPATGSAANAGNALKTIFSRLLSPTKDTAEVLGLMGINTRSFAWESANAQDKLIAMAQSFEKLSDSQKGLVSSIIASRYQVNRFEVLMNELTSANGYYQRALQSTADMNAVYRQSQQELNMVLTSSPKRLEIIWTMLKNAAADVIQPLIPLVLWLATAVMNLVRGFSNLNPAIQKFILLGLALLAVVGPIVRYLGAIQVLVFELIGLFRLALVPLGGLVTLFRFLVILPVQLFFQGLSIAARGMVTAIAFASQILPVLFGAMMTAIQVIVAAGAAIVSNLWRIWLASLASITVFFGNVIAGLWRVTWFLIEEGSLAAWSVLTRLWAVGLTALEDMLLAFAAFSGRAWRLITIAPLALFRALWTGVVSGFAGILPLLRTIGVAAIDALTGPIGIAITLALTLIVVFWDQIKQIWANAVNFFRNGGGIANAFKPLGDAAVAVKNLVLRAFNALPAGIRSAMLAVVDTIAAAAKAVYHWFSYLNPFAKHSPSLVDNVKNGASAIQDHFSATQDHATSAKTAAAGVTAGHADSVGTAVSTIKTQYAELSSVSSSFSKATSDLDAFADAIAKVQRAAEAVHYAEIRKQLLSIAADAVPAFDRLLKDLYSLEDQLKVVGKTLEAQKSVVDDLKTKLDAANDTLQIQKDVLDSMKDSVNNFSEQVQAINGDLETLTGTREMLRQAGAGSDVLKSYDDQINALKDQKKGINDQLDAAQKAYDSQKKLVDDLTAARDKLQESYDLENAKLKEIQDNYDAIKSKIDAITSAIGDFSSAASTISQASGKTSDNAENFAAGAGANFPDVGGTGSLGREGGIGDQASLIDDFTKQIQDKTKNLFGMFNFLDPIKRGWNAAWTWLKNTFGPITAWVGDFFSHLFDGVGDSLKNSPITKFIDVFKDGFKLIGDLFDGLWRLIGPPLKEIGKILMDEFGKAFKQIWPEIVKFKDLVGPLGDLFKELWTVLKPVAAIIGGVLLLAISVLASVLKNVLGPVIDLIIGVIKAVIEILRGLIEFLVGVFTGNWKLAWQGIKDFFGGIWDGIWSIIKNAGLIIWGIVKGIVEGIWNFFKWVYDELIGHSVIPDIVNGVMMWFQMMADVVTAIWNALVSALKWVWDNILVPVFEAVKTGIHWVAEAFNLAVQAVKFYWGLFVDAAKWAWEQARNVINWIKDKWNDIVNGIRDAVNQVKTWIDNFVGAITGIKDRIANAFTNIFDGLKNAFKDAVNWIIGKWNGLSFDLGPFHIAMPKLPLLASGGLVANQAMAIVGEGRPGYPEFVIPTDPQYRDRALALFERLGAQLGINHVLGGVGALHFLTQAADRNIYGERVQFFASGGVLGRGSLRGSVSKGSSVVVIAPQNHHAEYHFHGDMSFPNIRGGGDAKEFVNNLRALIG